MPQSNYELTRNRMRVQFLQYDQERMIRKFALSHDRQYLYLDFVARPHRIGRTTGVVEWSDDGFQTAHEAGFEASMTIYDVLCCSKDGCALSGRYCSVQMLKGVSRASAPGGSLFQAGAEQFRGRLALLCRACAQLGKPCALSGDAAYLLHAFAFMPVCLQFWDADEEFAPQLKFMFDENLLDYMHFETAFYLMGHILERLTELAGLDADGMSR